MRIKFFVLVYVYTSSIKELEVVEQLGLGTFLYLEKEGEPLVVETEGDSNIKVGDTVKVGFSASRCHLFDSSKQAFN